MKSCISISSEGNSCSTRDYSQVEISKDGATNKNGFIRSICKYYLIRPFSISSDFELLFHVDLFTVSIKELVL